ALARASTAGASATGGERRPRSSRAVDPRRAARGERARSSCRRAGKIGFSPARRRATGSLDRGDGRDRGLIRACAVQITAAAPDSADARWCVGQYFRELAGRFKTGFAPAKTIPATPDELTPPAGVFILARLGGQPIGCGSLKVKDRTIGEIKRMW